MIRKGRKNMSNSASVSRLASKWKPPHLSVCICLLSQNGHSIFCCSQIHNPIGFLTLFFFFHRLLLFFSFSYKYKGYSKLIIIILSFLPFLQRTNIFFFFFYHGAY
ncbi:hypothetical protein BDA99DRAFT_517686 [Phascolomyces articulosus]|uniref:Uncharacterized protein n=1 Tax=Phascolomyces articulosus TaxID=60185 RepID=A0AAD5JVP0_9FUNG|nr:hypothetical protein BDA99DRAFT_517686 [Phascolomyces articulosus]